MEHGEVKAGFDHWVVFEKVRAANRMRHRQAYETMEQVLPTAGFDGPPRILDMGCGDARDMAGVLQGFAAASYTGIDNSPEALERARANLAGLSCPRNLILGDYTEAFQSPAGSFDLIWLGLFLHHLPAREKEEFFAQAARLLTPGGLVLAHDPVLGETEDRAGFVDRLARACNEWPELTTEEKETLARHWSEYGHQERLSRLLDMAGQAGFSRTDVPWLDPDGFYAVMAFRR